MDPTNESLIWRTGGGDRTRRACFPRPVRLQERPARHLGARGAVQASVVFDANGRCFIADMAGSLQAFSSRGNRLWETRLVGGVSATPAVHPSQPQVFVGTHLGWVYALETTGGDVLWKKQVPTSNDPRILSDLLYLPTVEVVVLSSWGGRFVALDTRSGEERFSWDAGLSPSTSPSADRNGLVYCHRAVANQGVELVAVTAEGAVTVVHRQTEDKRGARRALVNAAPVLDEQRGVIYHISNGFPGSQLHATELKTGATLWSHPLPFSVQAPPVLRPDGSVVVADLAGNIRGIGPDAVPLFEYASGCEYLLAGGVSDAEGTVYWGDPVGVLHRIDAPGRGQAVFEARRGIQARPAFDPAGNLSVPAADQRVYVFVNQIQL